MTMGSQTMERSGTGQSEQPNVQLDTLDIKQIKSIQLADGWHDVQDARRVHFAVGEAQSPITPDKVYPALRYTNEYGKTVRTPLRNILSFSEESQGQTRR